MRTVFELTDSRIPTETDWKVSLKSDISFSFDPSFVGSRVQTGLVIKSKAKIFDYLIREL